jgi:methylglyoxal synthase
MKSRIALIAHDKKKDAVIFLRDPMTPQPHEPDINVLVRACDVHNVACAINPSTAHLLLSRLMTINKEEIAA